jgi:hypothetical protein
MIGVALACVATFVALNHGSAHAGTSPETTFVKYTPPVGPQITPESAANAAVRFARASGENGEVGIELAHGTLTQTMSLMEGASLSDARAREAQLRSSAPTGTFCFGGENAACTASEQQHAKETLYLEGQRASYVAVLSGSDFKPHERLPRGAPATTGSRVVLVFDAYTGTHIGMTVGSSVLPKLSELGGISNFVAPAQSATARAAATKPNHSHPPEVATTKPSHSHPGTFGSIEGTFARAAGKIVVFDKEGVFATVRVNHRQFRVAHITAGTYSITGRLRSGQRCRRIGKVTVLPQRQAVVHLSC